MLSLLVKVDHVTAERPDEGQVEGRVMRRAALHPGALAHADISVRWSQSDFSGICEMERDAFIHANLTSDLLSDQCVCTCDGQRSSAVGSASVVLSETRVSSLVRRGGVYDL